MRLTKRMHTVTQSDDSCGRGSGSTAAGPQGTGPAAVLISA